eukprot:9190389-Lingulodinium_polyedra.AAC.1
MTDIGRVATWDIAISLRAPPRGAVGVRPEDRRTTAAPQQLPYGHLRNRDTQYTTAGLSSGGTRA